MILDLGPAARDDLERLSEAERARVFEVIAGIPGAFREPARHSGIGLRKLHPRGYWEVRVGLKLRILFRLYPDRAVLLRIADHNGISRYLRSL